jgi:histidinol-phosphate phosphatase family protein
MMTYAQFARQDGIRLLGGEVPATGRPAVFLDRDGVINHAPPRGRYVTRWSDFQFIPGIDELVRYFKACGFLTIVVTNQRAVAMNLLSQPDLDSIHENMIADLSLRGAVLDDVFWCPHNLNSCGCRKPQPAMVLAAVRTWDIDRASSLVVGDSYTDEQLAEHCGVPFLRVREGKIAEFSRPKKLVHNPCTAAWNGPSEVLHFGGRSEAIIRA